ncbi:MAG: glycerophosphodiester phosphodiesterase [Pseudomonadota bacterium]
MRQLLARLLSTFATMAIGSPAWSASAVAAQQVIPQGADLSKIDVQGHRGARAVMPENTIPAFLYALELGVDTLELDTGVTSDGTVVVYHDQKINPAICQYKDGSKIKRSRWLHELTLEQVKDFDCGAMANQRFPNQTLLPGTEIPTLDEVLTAVAASGLPKSKKVLFNIETKSTEANPQAQPAPAEFVHAVLEVIAKHSLEDRVTLQSFDHRTLVEAHQQAPEIQRSALFRRIPKNWVTATQDAKAQIVSPFYKHIGKTDVDAIHDAGMRVVPWTANLESEWRMLINMGVDGIITDDPAPLLQLLGRK